MISVIIAAAGLGKRMGGSVKKQYRKVENLPVLVKTVKAFCAFREDFEIVVAGPSEDLAYIKEILVAPQNELKYKDLKVVAGGAQREDSVQNALAVCTGDTILIHDAARCFIDAKTIGRVVTALEEQNQNAVIPCVAPKSTIRTASTTLDRSTLYEVQTPQGFKKEILLRAFKKAKEDNFIGTDEGSYIDHLGEKVTIVEGDYRNIKITTEEDMPKETRVGYGYDVHKLVEGRKLMLGCIEVPYDKGLLGHSDADVLVHAIADALLGAAALRDIGYYFPDTAKETEGMPGRVLLEKVLKLVTDEGYSIVNIDGTIVAQKPKLMPHIEEMKKAIADVLKLDPSQVGIKATTEEGLGITGNGEAMAAHAVASIK